MMSDQKPHHGASVKSLSKPASPLTVRTREAPTPKGVGEPVDSPDTDLFRRAVVFASQNRRISISILQREFSIGFDEAEQLIDQMYVAGAVERPLPAHERETAVTKKKDRFFREDSDSFTFVSAPEVVISDKNGNSIGTGELYRAKNNGNYYREELLEEEINTYIEKIDHSFSEVGLKSLIEEALAPLFLRTDLNAAQKAEIIRVSSASFKACVDGNHGLVYCETLTLPESAPATWKHDRTPVTDPETHTERLENAGEFTRRVYDPWLGKGLTRNMLRKLDNPLFQALYRTYGATLPDDLPLPTKKEENDRWVARVEQEGLTAVIPDGASSDFALREAQRLLSARQRRNRDKS